MGLVARAEAHVPSPTPLGGARVSLGQDAALTAARVPSFALVPEGATQTTVSFPVQPVAGSQSGQVTASAGGGARSATPTIRPIGVGRMELDASEVLAGATVTGVVTLECPAAPGEVQVTLTSSRPAVASPTVSRLTFLAGEVRRSFTVRIGNPGALTTVTLRAASSGTAQSVKLTVRPAAQAQRPRERRRLAGRRGKPGA